MTDIPWSLKKPVTFWYAGIINSLNAAGEMGQPQIKKYDIESWMPSRESYGETHSSSKFHDFQARRMNARYRPADGTRFERLQRDPDPQAVQRRLRRLEGPGSFRRRHHERCLVRVVLERFVAARRQQPGGQRRHCDDDRQNRVG